MSKLKHQKQSGEKLTNKECQQTEVLGLQWCQKPGMAIKIISNVSVLAHKYNSRGTT